MIKKERLSGAEFIEDYVLALNGEKFSDPGDMFCKYLIRRGRLISWVSR